MIWQEWMSKILGKAGWVAGWVHIFKSTDSTRLLGGGGVGITESENSSMSLGRKVPGLQAQLLTAWRMHSPSSGALDQATVGWRHHSPCWCKSPCSELHAYRDILRWPPGSIQWLYITKERIIWPTNINAPFFLAVLFSCTFIARHSHGYIDRTGEQGQLSSAWLTWAQWTKLMLPQCRWPDPVIPDRVESWSPPHTPPGHPTGLHQHCELTLQTSNIISTKLWKTSAREEEKEESSFSWHTLWDTSRFSKH